MKEISFSYSDMSFPGCLLDVGRQEASESDTGAGVRSDVQLLGC